jgi:hypothetical protein
MPITPEQKNEIDAFMRLNEFRFNRWQNRRIYEWRVNFALWAWMAAAIYYLKLDHKTSPPPLCVAMIVAVVIVLFHGWWVQTNWKRNMKDINQAFYFWDRARILLPDLHEPPPREYQKPGSKWDGLSEHESKWYSFLCDAVPVSEIFMTILLVLTYFALGHF